MRNLLPDHVRAVVSQGELSGSRAGAALLIDAAGSTRLSANLREYGTDGAEALADVISAVFTPMVGEVQALNGFVAEFAGDGIIAVFLGDPASAAGRALQAGKSIMSALADLERIDTPAGPARLEVRGSIGYGHVEWRVWHIDDTEAPQNAAYTFVGTAIAEAQRGELITPAGVLTIGPAARGAVDVAVDGEELAEGFLAIEASRTPLEVFIPKQDHPDPPGWRFFPEPLTSSQRRGEFREVVSVFIELAELPDGGREPSSMTRLLNRVRDHGGYLCDVIRTGPDAEGVRALVFWGAPRSREHDIGHALRCVAGLRYDLGSESVKAGVTMDTMFAGYVGADLHESYTCIGAGVNLAARMCGESAWGEIRINERVAGALDKRWTYEDLGKLGYKGFPDAMPTFGLTRIPAVIRSFPTDEGFIGRSRELDELERALDPMWRGQPAGVVVVVGDAGMGKGHLLAELRSRLNRRTPPAVWLSGESNDSHSQPLATLVDALEGYFGGLTEDERGDRLEEYVADLVAAAPQMKRALEQAGAALADLLEVGRDDGARASLDPKARFENTVKAVRDLVSALASISPVIVHNADAQWLDKGTVDILARLLTMTDTPFAIVLDTREQLEDLPADHVIELGPLESDDIRAMARRMLGRDPSPDLVDLLMDRSAGNPFFAREILDFMRRELLFASGPNGLEPRFDGDELPTDLRRIVIAGLDGLGPGVLRTVQTAAVLGREFDHDVLQAIVGADVPLEEHLDRAIETRILEGTGESTCRFRHSVVRDTAYGMQLHSEVRHLHEAAAEAIQRLFPGDEMHVAELAYHFDRAGDALTAARHYGSAARLAADQFSNREALSHIDRALDLLGDNEIRSQFELHDLARSIHDIVGDRTRQQEAIDAMGLIAESPDQRLEVAQRKAELLDARGEYPQAEQVIHEALESPDVTADSSHVPALHFLLARLARHRGEVATARKLALQARSEVDGNQDPIRAAYIQDFLGSVAWDVGDFDEAVRHHRSASVALARAGDLVGEIRALNNLGTALFAVWDYPAARAIHEQGIARSREIGFRMGEGDHLDNSAGAAWSVGDYDLAIERYSAALSIRTDMEDAWGMAVSTSNLAGAYRTIGDLANAETLYRSALATDQRIGRRRGEAYDWHGLGLTLLDLGDHAGAVEALDTAIAIREELGETHLCNESKVACALAHKRAGNIAEATSIVETVLAEEPEGLFDSAAETTASFLRAIEVIDQTDHERARELRQRGLAAMHERASRISDPHFRRMYLENVASHRQIAGS